MLDRQDGVDVNRYFWESILNHLNLFSVGIDKAGRISIVDFQVIGAKSQKNMAGSQTDGGTELLLGIYNRQAPLTDTHVCVQVSVFRDGLCNGIAYDHTSCKSLTNLDIG